MDLNSSLNTSGSSDGVVQPLVDLVFLGPGQKTQRVSAIVASLRSENPDNESQKKFCQELQERLDPNNDDREVASEDFYNVCKDLYVKYQKTDFMSTNMSPVKSVTLDKADFSPIKRDICQYSLSESEISSCSSPSEDVYIENARLHDECHTLKSHIRRLEETKSSLTEQLSNWEDKNSELENRCKELEAWKIKLYSENIVWRRDAEAHESKIKELESQNVCLGKELTKVKKQCCELKEEKQEVLSLQNEFEEMQRHAEELHIENIEFKECLLKREEEIAALKAECEVKLTENRILIERIEILENENQSLGLAIQEKFQSRQRSTPIDSSDEENYTVEPRSLKEELGGSLPRLNTSSDTDDQSVLISSAVEEYTRPESPPVIEKNSFHATEFLPMTEENSCHAKESLPMTEENSCHANESEPVKEENPCLTTETISVMEGNSRYATEFLPVTEENSCYALEPLPVSEENPCHATEPESVTEENPCLTTESPPVMEENSCHPTEFIPVTEENPCHTTESDPVTEENPCHASEPLSVIKENSFHAKDPLPVTEGIPCHATEHLLVTEGASPLVIRRPESVGPIQHSVKWKIFLAILAYFLHNCVFGFLLLFAFVTLVSPYLNYNHLVRDRPWFVSVSSGSSWPPPV